MPQSYMPSSPRSLNPGMLPKLHKSLGLGSATPAHLRVICCVLTDYLQMRLSVPAFAHSPGSIEAPTSSDLAMFIWQWRAMGLSL